ncbi:hypothetical protein HK101_007090 [Irineochytrium annulatum]|nr:hypothetical protein HK101_007090 [Irineochytrium annulatum]
MNASTTADMDSTMADMNSTEDGMDPSSLNGTTTMPMSGWFSDVSLKFSEVENWIALAFSLLALAMFAVGRYRNRRLFERISLRLIFTIVATNAVFHADYIYSIYVSDPLNCRVSTFLYILTSLFETFLTTALAVNLFVIAVLKRSVVDRAFEIYVLCALIMSLAFALPPALMPGMLGFEDIDGCWFVGDNARRDAWTFYYGPLFVMAILNMVFAVAIRVAFIKHVRKMYHPQSSIEGPSTSDHATSDHHKSQSNMMSQQQQQPKQKRNKDSLISVALQVNYYVGIPFLCVFLECLIDSLDPSYIVPEFPLFLSVLLSCSVGIVTFVVLCFDKTLKKSLFPKPEPALPAHVRTSTMFPSSAHKSWSAARSKVGVDGDEEDGMEMVLSPTKAVTKDSQHLA